jgi:hypothetical protein
VQENILHTVPGAGHGLAYLLDIEGYKLALKPLGFPTAEN